MGQGFEEGRKYVDITSKECNFHIQISNQEWYLLQYTFDWRQSSKIYSIDSILSFAGIRNAKFQCEHPECTFETRDHEEMQKHISVHGRIPKSSGPTQHKCDVCGAIFYNKLELHQHQTQEHPGIPFFYLFIGDGGSLMDSYATPQLFISI